MKPAVCNICGKTPSSTEDNGDWVKFLDYDNEAPTTISHANGLEYFCGEHINEARRLDNINVQEALIKLNEIYPHKEIEAADSKPEKKWWTIFFKR